MTIKENVSSDNVLTLIPEGNMDTVTSPEFQAALLKGLQKCDNVILDFAGVSYISSAGLRALMIGQKTATAKGGSMKIKNVNEAVMKVFILTNFDKALQIEA